MDEVVACASMYIGAERHLACHAMTGCAWQPAVMCGGTRTPASLSGRAEPWRSSGNDAGDGMHVNAH